ncbi:cytochrome P450 [Mycena albidolilacea]|uniref:Cytochrome P450 n=1 Tax=Mycena albidolilacea TaxID=1033008 RepID=A0AAD6ZRM8_9AGAR|nr:cytochrome P450 [Mycena albidolilacea]
MASLIQALLLIATVWTARWLWGVLSSRRILNNIPGPRSPSLLTGHLKEIFSFDGWDFHHELGEKYGGVVRIDGMLGVRYSVQEKQLYVFDPKSLHQILVKVPETWAEFVLSLPIQDHNIFEEPHFVIRGTRVFFGEGILSTLGAAINFRYIFSGVYLNAGEQHKKQRKMLNPVFSAAHLRQMVPIFFGVGKRLRGALESRVQNGPKEVSRPFNHPQLWMTRTALELVGQAGLGYSFDPLDTDEIPPYIQSVKQMQVTSHKMALAARYILPWAVTIGSPKFRRFIVGIVPWKNLHDVRDILDTLYSTAVHIYNSKKAALEAGDEAVSSQIANGKDIHQHFNNASLSERLSEDEIIGQLKCVCISPTTDSGVTSAMHPTVAYHDLPATSSALSRTLHLLAQYPDVQEKLRQEIRSAQQEGADISYDQLNSMVYLDAICRETLRLYPPLSFIPRTTRKDVALTTSTPVTTVDGSTVTEVPVPAGTEIFVSILASNRNPAIWGPDSFEWKPERWLSSLSQSVADAHVPGIYSNLMTFNGGGRACIGFKFSQLEMKVVLCLLVERFKFSLSDKDISWQMSSIAVPSVDGTKLQLPLKVELAA